MSTGDWLSVAGLVLAVVAIGVAIVIYKRQSSQSDLQTKILDQIGALLDQIGTLTSAQDLRAQALANLELREKFGTISSRAERLQAIRGKTLRDLDPSSPMTREERHEVLDARAQIMYTIYDCLAVNEVYSAAASPVQKQFRDLMHGYDEVWADVPVLHGNREELGRSEGESLLILFERCLAAYASSA